MGLRFNEQFMNNPSWKGDTRIKGALKEYVKERHEVVGGKKEDSGPSGSDDREGFIDTPWSNGPFGIEGLVAGFTREVGVEVDGLEQAPGASGDRQGIPNQKRPRKPRMAKKARRASAPKG